MNDELARGLRAPGKPARATRGPIASHRKPRPAVLRSAGNARSPRSTFEEHNDLFNCPRMPDRRPASSRIGGFRACFGSDKLEPWTPFADPDGQETSSRSIRRTRSARAAEKMNAANVGAVVVVEDFARIVGIVTERDLMRAVSLTGPRPPRARVRQWMTPGPDHGRAQRLDRRPPQTSCSSTTFRHPSRREGRGARLGIVSMRLLSPLGPSTARRSPVGPPG